MAKQKTSGEESTFSSVVKPVLVLVVICVICSALLAFLNGRTAPLIEENEKKATMEAYLSVLPDGTDENTLTQLDVKTDGVLGAVRTGDGSVAIKAQASGYGTSTITVYVALDANGTVTGMKVDASTQTAGIGSKVGAESFVNAFLGWDGTQNVSSGSPVDGVSGATYSSNGVFNAMNSAIDCFNHEIKGAV
jgi:electron transport complex protein RnfG